MTRRMLEKCDRRDGRGLRPCVPASTGSATRRCGREHPAAQTTFRFDIPAGSLDGVLAAFETMTGLTIAAPPHTTIQGLTSPGVAGTFTPEQALDPRARPAPG